MTALVTGGGGFLGRAIVAALRARGEAVRSFSRGDYPELVALGAEHRRGDIADRGAVLAAAEGCDVVYHVAALPGIWGPYERYHRVNVLGTHAVLDACRAHGIRRLVYTSSPSVVSCGHDLEGIDESQPYPERFFAPYPETKAIAEQAVLAQNGEALATVALRPHLIWGPGDRHVIPRVVARARAGRLRRIGAEDKKVDTIYIDNAADAHLLAADRLEPGGLIAGKAYFLSNGEPIGCWEIINRFLEAASVASVDRHVPVSVAWAVGGAFELVYKALGLSAEPPMTRFLAHQLSTAHWFDISAARRELGYEPKVSIDEGLRRLRAAFEAEADAPQTVGGSGS